MANSKAITVAATMEPAISRRRLLGGLAAASATAATIAAPDVAEPAVIQDPRERARHHASELAAAMAEINPARHFTAKLNFDQDIAIVIGHDKEPPAPVVYDGPGRYEVKLTNGRCPIYWLERVDHVSTAGQYYRAQHYWCGEPQGSPLRLREKQIARIIRKIEDRRA